PALRARLAIAGTIDLHAIAPLALCFVTYAVGGRQQAADTAAVRVDRHQADADADTEGLVLPYEAEVANRFAQPVGNSHSLVERARFEQPAELVAADPAQGVAAPHLRQHHGRQLPQQLVAGGMAAGIVHRLEIVEIHVHQRVLLAVSARGLDQSAQAPLELAAVDQPR